MNAAHNIAAAFRRAAGVPIRLYRYCISPLLPPACRFVPTCSEYALEAIEVHGVLRGGVLTLRRLLRCGPWSAGGYDPVPERRSKSHIPDLPPAARSR
jgi:putative membrane protein insertion efficiency factor